MTITPPPTLTGFITFLRNVCGITSTVLPDNSDVIATAFQVAVDQVNLLINQASPIQYTRAVYNFGADGVYNYAQDADGAPPYKSLGDTEYAYFAYWRAVWKLEAFVSGVVEGTSDEGTSVSLKLTEAYANLTLADLQQLKTPFGRIYAGIAMQFGTLWGMS